MDSDWEQPSPGAAALIVAAVAQIADPPQGWMDEFNLAALQGVRLDEIVDDAALTDALRETNEGNLAQWAQHNLVEPGVRVPVRVVEDGADMVREMVRRGLDAGMLDAFRTAQSVAWRRWMEVCFDLTDDVQLLREVLDVTSRSISAFVDDTVAALADQIDVARAQLAGDTHAERRAAVALVLEGAPIAQSRAEAQLHYRLAGPQTAVVLTAITAAMSRLEELCEEVMSANRLTSRLNVLAGADRLWVWFPTQSLDMTAVLDDVDGVRIAIGRPGVGREGFRRSHFQALSADQTLTRLGSTRTVVRYDDLALIGVTSDDRAVVDGFISETLGELATADPELRECLRVWFAERCNSTTTAARLYTHRNTIVRRVARASDLLPIPLSHNAIGVAAALELSHWLP
ncbi:putative CdaR family transcriptional regulator [Gordonia effusa NBRC 100432]|uniref:Putative CdaR family transcriptional regulator n=1 Tax=Gordonia effusa NBRC 100432 TaxID=1077974 RepID=H0R0Q8_9ACTN|nr:helix-turn-helix domain-containing protein [Gordonia effusa]GAB18659.1 putative CdaR family transcriptional regulator [Gordonia effusa NBRC 100432]